MKINRNRTKAANPELTLTQRRSAYRAVLKIYKRKEVMVALSKGKRFGIHQGLCSKMIDELKKQIGPDKHYHHNFIKDEFPELYTQKPKTGWKENPDFWWSPFFITKRLKALEKAIEICKNKAYEKYATNLLAKDK